jgi:hypothetical protein
VEHGYNVHVISPHKKQQRAASCDFGKPVAQPRFMVDPISKKLFFFCNTKQQYLWLWVNLTCSHNTKRHLKAKIKINSKRIKKQLKE